MNFAPWTGDWLVLLSRSIRSVEGTEGYPSLRDQLIDPVRFDEAYSVLQVAERLVAAGLDIAFDQAVLVDGAKKAPDLLVRNPAANVQFHCEISVQYSAATLAEQSRAAGAVIESLLYPFHDFVLFSGRFLRPIAKSEIGGLAGRVQWELMEIEREPRLREIALDGALLLAIAPQSHGAELVSWAQKHGFRIGTLSGAEIPSDELARLRLKIEDEAEQLPPGYANLVVISAQEPVHRGRGPRSIDRARRGDGREQCWRTAGCRPDRIGHSALQTNHLGRSPHCEVGRTVWRPLKRVVVCQSHVIGEKLERKNSSFQDFAQGISARSGVRNFAESAWSARRSRMILSATSLSSRIG